nr:uncharacterized protein LOC129381619 [Dermacentor andersoni]
MNNKHLRTCMSTVLSAVIMLVYITTAQSLSVEAITTATEPKVGQSCDGNQECGPKMCCVRFNDTDGTVCAPLSQEREQCSNATLVEDIQPSCREDSELQAKAKQEYSPPYDKKCPCATGLECSFDNLQARDNDQQQDTEEKRPAVPLGVCKALHQSTERDG